MRNESTQGVTFFISASCNTDWVSVVVSSLKNTPPTRQKEKGEAKERGRSGSRAVEKRVANQVGVLKGGGSNEV